MAVTFFENGFEVSDALAARLDALAENKLLKRYVEEKDELPPGWPNNAARKALIEWGVIWLSKKALFNYEREVYHDAYNQDPFEGS
jgi:hypothetical protein